MKGLKKGLLGTTILSATLLVAFGSFNSIVVDKASFLKNDFKITFAKRLDDMNGEVTIGRMAASLPKFKVEDSLAQQVKAPVLAKRSRRSLIKPTKSIAKIENKFVPGPAVNDTPNLELTGGLFNKKPLKDGKGYEGTAVVRDGVIEEVNVTLPGGKKFYINLNERMVGNVFQYEDSETREMRSGLFYIVNKEKHEYMITLTDDTHFSGMRLEFKGKGDDEVKADDNHSFAMNKQNIEDNGDLDVNNYEDDSHEAYNVEDEKDAYAQQHADEEFQNDEQFENDNYEDENLENNETAQIQTTEEQKIATFGFKFNS